MRSVELKTHKIHFRPLGELRTLRIDPQSDGEAREGIGSGYPLVHTSPPRRLRHLDLGVFAAWKSVPNFYYTFMVTLPPRFPTPMFASPAHNSVYEFADRSSRHRTAEGVGLDLLYSGALAASSATKRSLLA